MGKWKNDAQVAVLVSYDFDAETLWTSRDPSNCNRVGTLSHGNYSGRTGVIDILEMLKQTRTRATFFVPGWTAEKYPDVMEAIVEGDHEVGHHSWDHKWVSPETADLAVEEENFVKTIEMLKKYTGKKPKGWRCPAGEVSPFDLSLLKKYELEYSSNMMADYLPYWLEIGGEKTGIVELPFQWITDDAPFMLFSVRPPYRNIIPNHEILELWKEEFLGIYRQGGLYNLCMHPQFSGRPSRVDMTRDLIHYMQKFPNVWFATGEEITAYWKENIDKFERQ